jgi:hypothetical protein
MMKRVTALTVLALINISALPPVASGCTSSDEIAASRTRWATVRGQSFKAPDNQANCRAYAASFYESVTLRQSAAKCPSGADQDRKLALLDSEVEIFNDLLAKRCGT